MPIKETGKKLQYINPPVNTAELSLKATETRTENIAVMNAT